MFAGMEYEHAQLYQRLAELFGLNEVTISRGTRGKRRLYKNMQMTSAFTDIGALFKKKRSAKNLRERMKQDCTAAIRSVRYMQTIAISARTTHTVNIVTSYCAALNIRPVVQYTH